MFRLIQTRIIKTRFRLGLPTGGLQGQRIYTQKIVIITKSVQRAFFANVLILRESAGFMFRRFCDLYRTGYFTITQDLFISRNRQFLLGACLFSFAQDMISDEEMIATAEGFDITNYNKFSTASSGEKGSVALEPKLPLHMEELPKPQIELNSLTGPITLYIWELRKVFLARQRVFLSKYVYSTPSIPIDSEIQIDEPPVTPKVTLAELVSHLSSDGSRFVDESWEMMVNRPHFRMWRRPLTKKISQKTSSQNRLISSYEYRVCGSFRDISAYTFLEVQLNLAYRRKWDTNVALLETVRSRGGSADPLDQTEVIRWVAKFPFPMARREYVYARRWWAEFFPEDRGDGEQQKGFALIISRAVLPPSTVSDNIEGFSSSPASSSCKDVVIVNDYESNMLIRSHGRFNEHGLDYFLSYSDDPQLGFSKETASRLSSTVIPRLLDQFHKAALDLDNNGFPEGVSSVVMKPGLLKQVPQKAALSEIIPTTKQTEEEENYEPRQGSSKRVTSDSPSSSPHTTGFFTDNDSQGSKSYQPFIS